MKKFALGTFSIRGTGAEKFAGLVVDRRIAPISKLAEVYGKPELAGKSVLALLDSWPTAFQALNVLVEKIDTTEWYDESDLEFHPAVDLPRQIFCTGANYRKHVVDMTVDANVGPEGLSKKEL